MPTLIDRLGIAVAGLLAMAVLGAFAGERWWLADLFNHFRPQFQAGLLALLALAAWRRRHGLLTAAMALAAINTFALASAWERHAPMAKEGEARALRLMTYNGYYLNPTPGRAMREVARQRADLTLMHEFANELMLAGRFLRGRYPAFYPDEDKNWSQRGIIARHSWQRLEIKRVPGPGRLAVSETRFPAIPNGLPAVTVIGVHTQSPRDERTTARRNQQIRDLARYVRQIGTPVIVGGDFNTSPWSAIYGEFLRRSGLYAAAPPGSVHLTWPGWLPLFLRTPIDHVFVSEGFAVAGKHLGRPSGSDHAPVIVDLVWRGES